MRFSFVTSLIPVAAALMADAATHMVMVGENNTLTFTPPSVVAATNDIISFQFMAKNHTATQSTFAVPCAMKSPPGVDSGFFPVAAGATTFATFNYTVTNGSAPTWFYCRQTGHCQQGMVFAVNPTATQSFAAFQANANMSSTSNSSMSSMYPSSTSSSPAATSTRASGALSLYGGSAAFMATLSGLAAGLFLQ